MSNDLENGHRATTAAGDNLVCDFVRGYADSFTTFADLQGRRSLRDDELGFVAVDNESRTMFLNPVVLQRPLSSDEAAMFGERVTTFFSGRPGGGYGVWSMWPTPDLQPFGFVLAGHPPFMLRAPGGTQPAAPNELRVVHVHDDDTGAAYEATLINGFPVADLQPFIPPGFFSGAVLGAPNWQHFVGYVDDEPVACASAAISDTVVRVDNVATLADRRGRGYGAAVTWAATLARPELPATLLASDAGRPVYERMGYRALLRATFWIKPQR